jgi:hypothetical protein
LQQLSKEAEKLAVRELESVLDDPIGMVRHTMRGIKAEFFLLEDETWWHQMFDYWDHIDYQKLVQFYEEVFEEVVDEIKVAAEAGIVLESVVTGFLGVLARAAALFFMLAFGPTFSSVNRGLKRYNKNMQRVGRGRGRATGPKHPNRKGLPPTPSTIGKTNSFQLRQLNPYVAYRFVEKCVEETKRMQDEEGLGLFDQTNGPGGLGAERPMPQDNPDFDPSFRSGEDVGYPDLGDL